MEHDARVDLQRLGIHSLVQPFRWFSCALWVFCDVGDFAGRHIERHYRLPDRQGNRRRREVTRAKFFARRFPGDASRVAKKFGLFDVMLPTIPL